VNLHGGTTSLVFSRACGARLRIGYEHYRSSWAYDVRIPAASRIWGREGIHTVEHLLTLLPWLGISVPGRPQGRLYLDEDARARARERLECHGIRQQAYLLMHPTATLFTKQWPPSHFARIGDLLHEQYGIPVIFTSAPDEIQVLREVEEHALARHRYWSDLALNELFALIDGCRLFVGNDSGPTHAAAALHKPMVVIWGSSNFRAWHPWGTEHELVRSDLPCMPCPGYSCAAYGKPRCILEITVEEVAQACNRILART
jgi:ADP-heptose:LPS heptosyltransferase